jgi:hypothetical protein
MLRSGLDTYEILQEHSMRHFSHKRNRINRVFAITCMPDVNVVESESGKLGSWEAEFDHPQKQVLLTYDGTGSLKLHECSRCFKALTRVYLIRRVSSNR